MKKACFSSDFLGKKKIKKRKKNYKKQKKNK